MTARQHDEEEHRKMHEHGGVIFTIQKMGSDKSCLIYNSTGYKSNIFNFNLDASASIRLLQECEKALTDVRMEPEILKAGSGYKTIYVLMFGIGQKSEPLIDKVRAAIDKHLPIMKEQTDKYHGIIKCGRFSDRLNHFLKGTELGQAIADAFSKVSLPEK